MATIPKGVTSRGLTFTDEYVYVYGTALNFTLNYAGWMDVCSGGVASATVINSGGGMNVSSGGLASGGIVSNGSMHILNGGAAVETTVSSRGYMCVSSGGTANGTIADFSNLYVYDGGVASETVIDHRAMVDVYSGGLIADTLLQIGFFVIHNGGAAVKTTVSSGGSMHIDGRGIDTTVNSGGTMYILNSGVAVGTTATSGGCISVLAGGVLTGQLSIKEGATVVASAGSIIDFAVAGEAGGAALINNLSRITDQGANYTITVAADQAMGTYALASGAAAFDKSVTVKTAETALGSLAVGETLTVGDYAYTLDKADGTLSLTIDSAPEPPPPPSTMAEVILTITDPNHEYRGATGGWKLQNDLTVEWQDLTTLGEGYSYLGLGRFTADKEMPDIYVYNAGASYIAAYITDDTGAITGFETAFLGNGALSQVGLADFTGDGVSDLLLRTADGFVGYYANGAFHEVQGLGLEWNVVALGDLDDNGRADVVIAHEAGYVGAYLIGNDGSISWADLGNLDANAQIIGAGDINGDETDDVIVQVGSNYYGAWLCEEGAVSGFRGIGTFDAEVQDISDYNCDGIDDLLLRTADGVVGAAIITGADTPDWTEYGALGAEWSTKGVGIL